MTLPYQSASNKRAARERRRRGDVADAMSKNPKTTQDDAPEATGSNTVKDPHDWTTGNEPMTGAQASYLKTLSEEAGEPFDAKLTKPPEGHMLPKNLTASVNRRRPKKLSARISAVDVGLMT